MTRLINVEQRKRLFVHQSLRNPKFETIQVILKIHEGSVLKAITKLVCKKADKYRGYGCNKKAL